MPHLHSEPEHCLACLCPVSQSSATLMRCFFQKISFLFQRRGNVSAKNNSQSRFLHCQHVSDSQK